MNNQKSRLLQLADRVRNSSISKSLESGIEFISDTTKKFSKELVIKSVSVIKPVTNTITETQDPLARFKKKSTIGPVIALASILGFLFKDKIFKGLSEINEFISPFFKFFKAGIVSPISKLTESITEKYETVKESVTSFIRSPIESIKSNADKLKTITPYDVVSFIGAGLGISEQSIEKLMNLGSKIKSAVSGIFGRFVSSPFNIFSDIVTGKFAFSIAAWVFNKTKSIFSNIISFGNKSATEVKYMNAQYSEENYANIDSKPKSLFRRFVSFVTGSDESGNTVAPNASQSAPVESNGAPNETISNFESDAPASSGSSEGGIAMQEITEQQINTATIFQSKSGRWSSKDAWLRAIIAIESMGKANADNGTFEGLFQLSRKYAMYNVANRFNPHDNFRMAKTAWNRENIPAIKRAGFPITPLTLYMTHQQGSTGGIQILKNWKNNKPVRARPLEVYKANNGINPDGSVMNDIQFTNKWIREINTKSESLRKLTEGGSTDIKPTPVLTQYDNIKTITVSKIPATLSNKTEKQKEIKPIHFTTPEFSQSGNQASTIEFSAPADLIPVRLNSPNIIKMTLSTRML